ncbi:hypothetical protein AAFN60_08135 [Roseibacillus persicicus]|uniref:hypothetical protein n=1 Tax=Roseibacillus persicicus TaxID=454148 RepID=UPI00398A7C3B
MSPATLARGQTRDLLPLFAPEALRQSIPRAVGLIVLGAGFYGFTVGLWRGLDMACYVALKTPLLLFFTLLITGLLNGMLGLLLGTGIGYRQSVLCQLLAFSLASVLLASLAPVTLFLALEAPPADSPEAASSHSFYLLIHTAIIGLGGFLAVVRLFGLIRALTPDFRAARLTLLSWLGSNAIVGAQLSYLMRPFFGSPALKVEFLRKDMFNGTFYEAVWRALNRLLSEELTVVVLLATGALAALFLHSLLKHPIPKSNQQ